jgi:RNA polymerase sigma-70 factor (sigma-E family)
VTFDEFVAAELPALARYARALTGDRQHAHDALADALVAAQARWRRIGAMEFPAAYVRRIVTTTYLGQRRRWSARHIGLTPTGQAPDVALPDPSASVDDRDELRALLASLPRQQRAAVVLRYYLGLSDAEIGDEIGCAPVTVRSYISRGLAAMRVADPARSTAKEST